MTEIIGAGSKLLIQEVVDRYGISRPTIVKALKAGDLSGEQDKKNQALVHRDKRSPTLGIDQEAT